jgi:hypothetical protein
LVFLVNDRRARAVARRMKGIPHTGCCLFENAIRSGGHWNTGPRPIIVQQRHEREGSEPEATTRWLKEQLEDSIAQHEKIAEEIERATEPGDF